MDLGTHIPPGWCRPPAGLLFPDPLLQTHYARSVNALYCGTPTGFILAYPYSPRRPFPLVPLFCFAHIRCLDGCPYLFFFFDRDGAPAFPHNPENLGEATPATKERR